MIRQRVSSARARENVTAFVMTRNNVTKKFATSTRNGSIICRDGQVDFVTRKKAEGWTFRLFGNVLEPLFLALLAAALLVFLARATRAGSISAELIDVEARWPTLREVQLDLSGVVLLDEHIS